MRTARFLLLALAATFASAQTTSDVVCSYAPSQSNAVAAISGAAGGSSATVGAVAAATGLTVVTHSSGALILTGGSGYIAGTIGAAAAAAPVVVAIGLIVGGAAVTVEVVCASKNHPEQVAKVQEAATEFARRSGIAMQKTKIAVGDMKKSVSPAVGKAAVDVKRFATDVWKYAYRKSAEASNLLNR